MTNQSKDEMKAKIQLDTLKAVIKAGLTQAEIKLAYFLLNDKDKYFALKYDSRSGLTHSNYIRTIKTLIEKNVINSSENSKHVKDENYVTGFTKWGFENKQN